MGKITGFLEFPRQPEPIEPPADRKHHWHEFIREMDDKTAQIQAARCMDCATPFCQNGCPVNNIIPDWNDLVYRADWKRALDTLLSTNNFPDFTGRICPAPCEAACTLNIASTPVGIKAIEHKIIDKGWEMGWVVPQRCEQKTGKRVAIVGSGPSGMAAAQQLARVGHAVTVFEKNDRPGGLLRYGIPDFKLEKLHVQRRIDQMRQEDVVFRTSVFIGNPGDAVTVGDHVETIAPAELLRDFDAVILCTGSETPRDLPAPGRDLAGVHFAMEFLPQQNQVNAGDKLASQLVATGKHVVVIGGGDTGSDCVGTSNRQGAQSVTQLELMPQPPVTEDKLLTWPYWPLKLRTSSSHQEGCERDWAVGTKRFNDDGHGRVKSITVSRLERKGMKMVEIPDTDFELPAGLVLLAMGFLHPRPSLLDAFGIDKDARGNAKAGVNAKDGYRTNVDKVFAAGDTRRGQSLVVWAIREGRQAAHAVDEYLMGSTRLPR
ncbi:MAG TPA: glutamate synthase subunit beta [Rhodanobacteraceae bacterium]|nr:glutamate synthase subunit beta [Rhodanobacteraceae bacterium]